MITGDNVCPSMTTGDNEFSRLAEVRTYKSGVSYLSVGTGKSDQYARPVPEP